MVAVKVPGELRFYKLSGKRLREVTRVGPTVSPPFNVDARIDLPCRGRAITIADDDKNPAAYQLTCRKGPFYKQEL